MFFLHISFYLAVPDHPGCHLSRLFGPLPRHCFKFKMLSDLQSFVYIYIYIYLFIHIKTIYIKTTHTETHIVLRPFKAIHVRANRRKFTEP